MKVLSLLLATVLIASPVMAANLTVTIPNEDVSRVSDAFNYSLCEKGQVPDEVSNCSTLSLQRFMQQDVLNYIKSKVRKFENRVASKAAKATVTDVELTEE